MNRIKSIILFSFYIIALLFLSVYSYSQVDLNLTLSANETYQMFQQQLIGLGYYNRPVSAFIFVALVVFLYIYYFIILYLINKEILSPKKIYLLIILSILILFFSYPSFSHDIFNYIFDARIVTKYFSNPYMRKALDFPSDPWIRFMHWTHRTYPYGPVWLILTLPSSFLGFGKFVLTLLNFKFLFAAFHAGNIILINIILKKVSPKSNLMGISFYALNPLILVESLVSPHNEVVMLFFLLLSIYGIIIRKSAVLGMISLFFSIGVKFITAILLPLLIIIKVPIVKKWTEVAFRKTGWRNEKEAYFFTTILLLLIPLIYQFVIREPYPWYFIPFIGVGALLVSYKDIRILLTGASFAFILRYAPFLFLGEYSPKTYYLQSVLSGVSLVITLIWVIKTKKGMI